MHLSISEERLQIELAFFGKEFWSKTRDRDYLVLKLKDEPFRIILTVDSDRHLQ